MDFLLRNEGRYHTAVAKAKLHGEHRSRVGIDHLSNVNLNQGRPAHESVRRTPRWVIRVEPVIAIPFRRRTSGSPPRSSGAVTIAAVHHDRHRDEKAR
jgi:hypothetical protein